MSSFTQNQLKNRESWTHSLNTVQTEDELTSRQLQGPLVFSRSLYAEQEKKKDHLYVVDPDLDI